MGQPMNSEPALREAICRAGLSLYTRNLVAATDGNLSARIGEGRYLCTPSGISLGEMQPGDLVIADAGGAKLEGDGKVSSEFFTHLAAYEERPDIGAIVHAHPPNAVALTLAGISMEEYVLPELVAALGGVPMAPYATPGTKEGADVIRDLIRDCDALLLDRHGALTVGDDVADAYRRMEKVEHSALSLLKAHLLGKVNTLDPDQLDRILKARADYGVTGKFFKGKT